MKEKFDTLFENLRNNALVNVEQANLGNPLRASSINAGKEEYQKVLGTNTISIFQEFNSVFLAWKYSMDHDHVWGGEIRISPYLVILGKSKVPFEASPDNKKMLEFLGNIHLLDHFQYSLQSTLKVGLELRDGAEHLWLWNDNGEKYPLTLSIPQYFERLLETKGFIGWQYFFVDLGACDFSDPYFSENFAAVPNDGTARMEEFLQVMPKLFPDQDYAFYQERLVFFKEANAKF